MQVRLHRLAPFQPVAPGGLIATHCALDHRRVDEVGPACLSTRPAHEEECAGESPEVERAYTVSALWRQTTAGGRTHCACCAYC